MEETSVASSRPRSEHVNSHQNSKAGFCEDIKSTLSLIDHDDMFEQGCTSGGVHAPCVYSHGLGFLLLCLCDVFRTLINSLVC